MTVAFESEISNASCGCRAGQNHPNPTGESDTHEPHHHPHSRHRPWLSRPRCSHSPLQAQCRRGYSLLAEGTTDDDGRIRDLLDPGSLEAATYRMLFSTGAYFEAQGIDPFYPEAQITFVVHHPEQHYHIPLLLSPYGYSAYRGSGL